MAHLRALICQWIWLGLRHHSLTLPSVTNPRITSGGLAGEGKLEYFEQMGPIGRAATAPWLAVHDIGAIPTDALAASLAAAGIGFPLVAKPDLVKAALARLRPGGSLLLYTGVAMTGPEDAFLAEIAPLLEQACYAWRYQEIDPDVFGDEVSAPGYEDIERIRAVWLHAVKRDPASEGTG